MSSAYDRAPITAESGIWARPAVTGRQYRVPQGCETGGMSDFTIVNADDVDDYYAGTSVPGEFRRLGDALGSEQLAVTLIRVPPHCDFEQGTGHYHEEIERST